MNLNKTGGINIKTVLLSRAGMEFWTSVLKISLIKTEEQISSVLIAEYHVQLEEEMIKRALTTQMFEFIKNIWKFKKNYYIKDGVRSKFSFKFLFDAIIRHWDDQATTRINEVIDWKLPSDGEDVLLALLEWNMDTIATNWAEMYFEPENKNNLFKFALRNENEMFMKFALKEAKFDNTVVDNQENITKILEYMEKGFKFSFCWNILIYSNFGKWRTEDNRRLVNILSRVNTDSDEK